MTENEPNFVTILLSTNQWNEKAYKNDGKERQIQIVYIK